MNPQESDNVQLLVNKVSCQPQVTYAATLIRELLYIATTLFKRDERTPVKLNLPVIVLILFKDFESTSA